MTRKQSSEAVLAAAARAEARTGGAEVQFDLLPPTRFHPVDHEGEHRKMAERVATNRRGRPPGAQNKTTREMLDFVRKTIGDPLLESARWLLHTPESLAAELGCDVAEAFDRLEKIRSDLRPYFYAKQAPVDAQGKPVPGLTMMFSGQGGPQIAADGTPRPPWLYLQDLDAPSEQNQRLIDVSPSVSNGDAQGRTEK
ncbi:hypothetical protein IP86_03030 [Rhodopseudomonas sp. AAP120]|uniref:hypothetical protein n=1 Tax=Rhodopseudomonas sp. AAP120 TaxID=1523430 RepID=UPI0006B9A2A1|nr:hypothetical protein [Rhodopseudomonas sp. AAP120]KPG01798.1 hypothetical protein IP86_03030 [Rhodopseudomonas sp. AAP120]